MDIDQLNISYGIQDRVSFETGNGGFPFIHIQNQSASALISLYGGQILSFKPADEKDDMLFLSKKAIYNDGEAIRGGIPVCWPWFGPDPKGLQRPNHGFVRNNLWTVTATTTTDTETKISLRFTENHKKEKTWKQPFTLTLEFSIASTLSIKLITENTGEQPFSITQAFHTYFNVGDINRVQVLGLEGCAYFDKLDQGKKKMQTGIVMIGEEVDRIYEDIRNHLTLNDPTNNRRIEIVSENCRTGVVWNPWQKAIIDLDAQDYQRFVCVETGNIAFDLVQVPPSGKNSFLTSYKILRG
ncbi:aldose 1-epimerase [Methyloglobulus morosus KoM1]|uniref:Putative glucose-6-phosphate 1-epimerase n=1 Tax=Methyloglobulus morosus KoM1 TaxID=1116472 RepID=V5BKZ0_9GAMM|nr:D-hexose-6-phosphate mutarotase [Methyloglobulus morosus]ESS66807.1 aldose 1-epimerase [Methyloglobulus morosus KoM1]